MAKRSKPVILGMADPSGTEALGIIGVPKGAAGFRLWEMSGLTRAAWLAAFDRVNLVGTRAWSLGAARRAAPAMRRLVEGRTVVVLGKATWAAMGFPNNQCRIIDDKGTTWHFVPHPSGRNLAYNEPAARRRTGRLLRRLACRMN